MEKHQRYMITQNTSNSINQLNMRWNYKNHFYCQQGMLGYDYGLQTAQATEHFTAAAAQIQLLPSSAHFVVLELIILMWYARVTLCIAYVYPREVVSNSFVAATIYFKVKVGTDMCAKCISMPDTIIHLMYTRQLQFFVLCVEYPRNC